MRPDPSLKWRCRRGIREMDLLLQAFVDNYFDTLSAEEITAFENLLEQPDLDIMDWIMGRSTPPSPAIKTIIDQINKAVESQSISISSDKYPD
jgi:antitoxin CptB